MGTCQRGARFLLLAAAVAAIAHAAESPQLTDAQRMDVIRRIEASDEFRKATAAQADRRLEFANITTYTVKPKDGPERQYVQTLHFKYDGGRTVRTTYDLTANRVVKIESLEAYPTPLSPGEVTRAVNLAREKSDRVRAILTLHGDKANIQHLAPVIADRADRRFGHRLVILTVRGPKDVTETATVEVDLTAQTVAPAGHNGGQ
jgi:hypothetical protein